MYSSTQIHINSFDPICPHCGRPVLGLFVQGNAGRYHPECVQSPYAQTAPQVIPFQPYAPPVNPRVNPDPGIGQPAIICSGGN